MELAILTPMIWYSLMPVDPLMTHLIINALLPPPYLTYRAVLGTRSMEHI